METITITLDGVEVSGYAGMTILDLARESDVEIPTLCYDPCLIPTGACRVCLVEDESSGTLVASCVTPIRSGMVIKTRSERVIGRRKVIVQLLLSSHPDSCMVCDKGNRCQLRKLASEMGIGLLDFQRITQPHTIEEVNPYMERDLSKCILCAKCIRADHELVVEGAIDYIGRGFSTKPATFYDLPLEKSECTFCGTCVALCPTGALIEKERTYHGTTTSTVETVCPFCGCGCGLRLEVKDNRLVRAGPGASNPVNHNTLCVRGSYGYDFVHSHDRLINPLIRTGDDFQEASWEHALCLISDEFRRIKEKYGPDSLAVFGSSKCTNEENYLLQRFARAVLDTNNIDNGSRVYSAPGRIGLGWTIGIPGTTSELDDLEKSEVIMVVGANPVVSAPAVGYTIKRAVRYKGARLILIDPRETGLALFAQLWLKPAVGTDAALLACMSKVIVEERLFDKEFITRRADNYTEFEKSLEPFTGKSVEEITGLSLQDIQLAARLFATAESASIVYGNGLAQNVNAINSVMALANLSMLTGNVTRRGRGIYALQRENNAQGACDMGSLPDFLPGYQGLDDAEARQKFEARWRTSLPSSAGLNALEMMEQATRGKIKGMLIVGENPVSSLPCPSLVREAFSSLEFLAASDLFPTETVKSASVVLPAASFAEKEGTFTNFEGRVQHLGKAIEPVGHSLPDWQIIIQLADRMGYTMPYTSPQEVMDEIKELVPLYRHLGYSSFSNQDADLADLEDDHLGLKRLHKGPFPSGFGRFAPADYAPSPDGSRDEYPFALMTGSILHAFGCGTRSSRASRLRKFSPNAWLEIGQADAKGFGFRNGDRVKIVSPNGEITANLSITETLLPGTLFLPISFPQSPFNELFGTIMDSEAKFPSFKSCTVRLERIGKDD
jgi:formate dehydrogenase alpha subunit